MKGKILALFLALMLTTGVISLPTYANEFEVDVGVTQSMESDGIPSDNQTSEVYNDESIASENTVTITEKKYPTDVQYDSLGSKKYIYKTYKISEAISVESIIEQPYKEDGYNWKNTEIIPKETLVNSKSKDIAQKEELVVTSENKENALDLFSTTKEYKENGFIGTLSLDELSFELVSGEESNYTYNYTISEVREYPNLDRNDLVSVPKTITAKGTTLTLKNVNWKPTDSTGSSGYSDYNTKYTAVANYTGTDTGNDVKVTDYVASVNYVGAVVKPAVNAIFPYILGFKKSYILMLLKGMKLKDRTGEYELLTTSEKEILEISNNLARKRI